LYINPSKTVVITSTKKRALKGLKEKPCSCPQKLNTLEKTLHKGLMWGAQLDKVTNRAYRLLDL
jgi:hypothetical protein